MESYPLIWIALCKVYGGSAGRKGKWMVMITSRTGGYALSAEYDTKKEAIPCFRIAKKNATFAIERSDIKEMSIVLKNIIKQELGVNDCKEK